MARSVLKAVDTDLPYPGLNDGSYFVYLPESRLPRLESRVGNRPE